MSDIEKLTVEIAALKAQVVGQQNEIARLLNHLDDMRTLVNRLTEANTKIEYTPIMGGEKDDRKRTG